MLTGITLGLILGNVWLNRPEPESPYTTETVGYRTIVQEVSATGSIEPTAKITLRFQISGTVDSIPVKSGDLVSKGDLLISLDEAQLSLAVASAQAELRAAQADYALALAGSTSQAIDVAEAAVEKAEADLEQAEENLDYQEKLGDQSIALAELQYDSAVSDYENLVASYELEVAHAYENAVLSIDDALQLGDDALREIDLLLAVDHEPTDSDVLAALQVHNSSKYTSAVNSYKTLSADYETLSEGLQTFEASQTEELTEALADTSDLLEDVNGLLEDVDALVDAAPILEGFDDTVRSEIREDLATEKAALLSAQSDLSTQEQAIESILNEQESELMQAENAIEQAAEDIDQAELQKEADVTQAGASVSVYESLLNQAKASLAEVKADPRRVDVAAFAAAITRAEAQLAMARHDVSLSSLVAPTQGVVTEVYFEEGESLNATDNVIQIVTTDYHILANIPESDITKLSAGDPVTMTLDAFAYDQTFEGKITEIDPSETVVEGVIYYQVKAAFNLPYEGIKPGMTANMDIVTAEEDHALAIPLRALKYEKDRVYVEVLDAATQTVEQMEVKLGIRDDQYVQILSGLEEGDEIVTLTKE